jgi:hypothetical protein
MLPQGESQTPGLTAAPEWASGTPLGKRYVHNESNLEVLAVKGGDSSLAVGGAALELKGAKPLPASD